MSSSCGKKEDSYTATLMMNTMSTGRPFQSDGDWNMWGNKASPGRTEITFDSVAKAQPAIERRAGQDEEEKEKMKPEKAAKIKPVAKKAPAPKKNKPVKAAKKPVKKLK